MSGSSDTRTQIGRRLPWLVAALLVLVLAATTLPTLAQSATDDPVPDVVFLARADNPVDALAASSIAGTLGGTVLLTPTASLSSATEDALLDLNPDLVVLAGGTAAVSDQVEQDVQALGLATQRVSGPTRVETAVELGALAAQLGIGRPILTDATVDGGAGLSGTLSVDALEVDSDTQVANLNASLLEGLSASELQTPAGPAGGDLSGEYPDPTIADGAVGADQLAEAEAFRVVGTTGEPAFENDWGNFSGDFTQAGFFRDLHGMVHLQGTIVGSSGTTAFTLPEGYRPSEALFLPMAGGGPEAANLIIWTDGRVEPACDSGSCTGGIDGLSFKVGSGPEATSASAESPND